MEVIRERVPYGSQFADPMCGTAAVSQALAQEGYSVVSSDALAFPILHAKARLLYNEPPNFEGLGGYDSAIAHLNNLKAIQGYFYKEFSPAGDPNSGGLPRSYFTPENAMRIDAVRGEIRWLFEVSLITVDERDLLLHDLTLAVNDVANITGTYGYFRSTWNSQSLSPLALKPEHFEKTYGNHHVFQAEALDALSTFQGLAVYLDPPYTKRQYGGNYHVLETIAMGDEPKANGAGGLREWRHQSSEFCFRRKAPGAFRKLLDATKAKHVFVSYSIDGQVPAEDLHELLLRYGNVERFDFEIPRFRSNSRTAWAPVTEYLYHVEREE